ncbi:MAG TPA: methyltransferase domain-containing protein [Ktedonobacteraceae bacterium]|nr:methyltransferase domain-containing protein [Ktedonobacteraceae bacterium]
MSGANNNPSSFRDQSNTYFMPDRASREETIRLQIQDQMINLGMGGVLPEQDNPIRFEQILDIGCGTGGWLIEAAVTYPAISRLVGLDVNGKFLAAARKQAEQQQVSDRVQFQTMDILQQLEFPSSSFDLVNQRLAMSYLRIWDWPKALKEYQRVTRPGGIIRLTESDFPVSTSAALTRLSALFLRTLSQAGHFFTPDDPDGVINELASLLQRQRLTHIQTQRHTLEYRTGTPEWQSFYENVQHMFRTLLPFFHKWSRVPDDYEEIYQQALNDILQPDFVATWTLLTAWGTKE